MHSTLTHVPVHPAAFATARNSRLSPVSIIRSIVCVLFGLLLVAAAAFAQVETGQIAGTVTDDSGAVVPNATVTVRYLSSNAQRATKTSPTGSYIVVGLPPGTYEVSVLSQQFKQFKSNIEVTVGGHSTLDAKLSANATVTEVQVVAEGGAQVNTSTQEISQVIDSQQVMQLPSLTRNPYDFVAISGIVSNGDAGA
jgi:hypothetical protein